ncbi:MAG: N-acetyltransferase [Planctomycetes bacterium]|nr:N-acetyltransferase [Planctomycetota bacterium]
MTIRLATPADAEDIVAIYGPVVRDTPISFEFEPPTVEQIQQRITESGERYPWIVDEVDGDLRGYAHASPHRHRAAYQWCAEVSVYVSSSYQRQGVARKLYRDLCGRLRDQGFVNVYAGIALPNPASVAMHAALGFESVGVYRRVGFKLGKWHDVGWWGLRLRETDDPTAD